MKSSESSNPENPDADKKRPSHNEIAPLSLTKL